MFDINNKFSLQQITETVNTAKLSLGKSQYTALKIFLQKDALDFHRFELVKTFVLINPAVSLTRAWGYISLMNSEIVLSRDQRPTETTSTKRYDAFSAVKIARLAVDKNVQGQGLGRFMLDWSINYVQTGVMPLVGCRYLTVDSKQESITFYKKNGFIFLEPEHDDIAGDVDKNDHTQMFYDLYKASQGANSKTEIVNISHSMYATDTT